MKAGVAHMCVLTSEQVADTGIVCLSDIIDCVLVWTRACVCVSVCLCVLSLPGIFMAVLCVCVRLVSA